MVTAGRISWRSATHQPSRSPASRKSIDGYTYQFHRQVDYRDLSRK